MTMDAGPRIAVRDPLTGETEFEFEADTPAVVAAKAARLRQAQPAWGAATLEHRIAVLRAWGEAVGRHASAISEADSRDTGYGQISRIAPAMIQGFIRGATAAAPHQWRAAERAGQSPIMPSMHYRSLLRPFPLAGIIAPWNAPTMLSMMRLIPAALAGCAVLVKPSEVTPRHAEALQASFAEVPELAAVVDYAMGDGATGAAVVEHADLISFTGSVPNGRRVAEGCARRFIPCELELGGKDPLIVTATADLDDAVSAAVRGTMTSTGQVCFSIERVYVQRPIHDAFVERLVARCRLLKLNYPDRMQGQIGPFTFARQAEIVDGHLDEAVARGARIVAGGKHKVLGGGLYMEPTVLTGVTNDMAIMQDETFGPVAPVMAFDTVDEAVALANDTQFGLSAAVMAGTEEEALAIAARLNAGNISVQDAFLTFAAGPGEADAFGASGVAGKRSGIQRYLRRSALLINSAKPVCLTQADLASV